MALRVGLRCDGRRSRTRSPRARRRRRCGRGLLSSLAPFPGSGFPRSPREELEWPAVTRRRMMAQLPGRGTARVWPAGGRLRTRRTSTAGEAHPLAQVPTSRRCEKSAVGNGSGASTWTSKCSKAVCSMRKPTSGTSLKSQIEFQASTRAPSGRMKWHARRPRPCGCCVPARAAGAPPVHHLPGIPRLVSEQRQDAAAEAGDHHLPRDRLHVDIRLERVMFPARAGTPRRSVRSRWRRRR